jgi:integrase
MGRDGKYVRQNFNDLKEAQLRQIELEADYHSRKPGEGALRSTKLTDTQLRIAEVAFVKLDHDEDLLIAVGDWIRNGRRKVAMVESPRLDDAIKKFKTWLDETPTLRKRTKTNLRLRVDVFANSTGNTRLDAITAESVEAFLAKRKASTSTKDNDRRALSRFFSWCIERPRRWMMANPAREVRLEKGEYAPPAVLSVVECKALLEAAETRKKGRLVPYFAVCLFAGLRPFEAARLSWKQVNLADGEIRLEANQTKTGVPRVVTISSTLKSWLEAHEDKPFFPANWRKDFDAVKESAGWGSPDETDPERKHLKPWPEDVLRHTAISHYFRLTGSYGQTAEQFGNSEAIIKKHYQGRVSSADTKLFYESQPKMKAPAKK